MLADPAKKAAPQRKIALERIAEIEAELETPPLPKALAYLWKAYFRLRRRCSGGFTGPNPVSWRDFDAFARQARLALAPWEIEILERIDDCYLQPSITKRAAPKDQPANMISARDGASVRRLLRSIAGRKGKVG